MSVKYTLVRHTAFSQGNDGRFANAVENRAITSKEQQIIEKHGGLIYEDYKSSYEAMHSYNYPYGYAGIIPKAKGIFKKVNSFDEEFFLPR